LKRFRDISLKRYNTFGLNIYADRMISIESEDEAVSLFSNRKKKTNLCLVLGGGSNMLFTGNFNGTVLHPEIDGIRIEERHHDYLIISAGSGVVWDELVGWSVENGFGGLENLSLIPGTVGASPVQNIGAYGVEVKDTIEKVRAVKISDGSISELNKTDCNFSYRSSIFKFEEKNKYLITRVFYRLTICPLFNLDYGSLKDEVNELGNITLKNVRAAVIKIRKNKLPDPEITGNAGSFFRNPVVSNTTAETLQKLYPAIPSYRDQSGCTKLAAGWLIEQCGWKGKRIGDAGVYEKQALILVNHGKATGEEIYNLSEEIRESVSGKFGIELEREVEVVRTI
jgi:UDP-N-acetylmuramate dehydrogenase